MNPTSKKLEDTIYNTVTAMTNRLVRYNYTEANILVSIIKREKTCFYILSSIFKVKNVIFFLM